METHAPRAVFLSYASQDAEAARRNADALRGFAIEVWFDQSGPRFEALLNEPKTTNRSSDEERRGNPQLPTLDV